MKVDKKGVVESALIWWIIAVVVLIIFIVAYIILRNTNFSLIEAFKNLFRFR